MLSVKQRVAVCWVGWVDDLSLLMATPCSLPPWVTVSGPGRVGRGREGGGRERRLSRDNTSVSGRRGWQ